MPFEDKFNTYYNQIIKPSILDLNIAVIRGDEIYSNKPIINDIIDLLIESDFVVADVSNKSPNVNYELGLAHALCKEVIILSQSAEDIPFDYRHLRVIVYNKDDVDWAQKLSKNLKNTIRNIKYGGYTLSGIPSLENYYKNKSTHHFNGLQNIFTTRQAMNIYLSTSWDKEVKKLDIIAFGLKSFRDSMSKRVLEELNNGLEIRIITPDPESIFLEERENKEDLLKGSIKKTIIDLFHWSKDLNKVCVNKEGVMLRFYRSLPLDFLWIQDDNVFIGPYLHGIGSQQTLTFQFKLESTIGNFYSTYFENIWNDTSFTTRINQ